MQLACSIGLAVGSVVDGGLWAMLSARQEEYTSSSWPITGAVSAGPGSPVSCFASGSRLVISEQVGHLAAGTSVRAADRLGRPPYHLPIEPPRRRR
jgi:hypothetical protein